MEFLATGKKASSISFRCTGPVSHLTRASRVRCICKYSGIHLLNVRWSPVHEAWGSVCVRGGILQMAHKLMHPV